MTPRLTPTERKVQNLVCQGLDTRAIAARLGIRYSTVRAHLLVIYSKCDVHSRAELIASQLAAVITNARQAADEVGSLRMALNEEMYKRDACETELKRLRSELRQLGSMWPRTTPPAFHLNAGPALRCSDYPAIAAALEVS